MKKIILEPNVPADLRTIEQRAALSVPRAIHRYAETGTGPIKALSGEFDGFLRLRVGDYRVFFKETAESITIHRIRDRKDACR